MQNQGIRPHHLQHPPSSLLDAVVLTVLRSCWMVGIHVFESRILSVPWFLLVFSPSTAGSLICKVQCLIRKVVKKSTEGIKGGWEAANTVVAAVVVVITVANKETKK